MWRTLVSTFSVAVLMTGCSYFRSETPDPKVALPESPPPSSAVVAPAPRHKPSPPATPSPAKPSYDPSKLIGLSEAEVSTIVGEPGGKEEQAPARIWRYVAGECVVKLFFYLDLDDEEFHLLTYETNQPNSDQPEVGQPNGGADAAQRCFDQVLGQRAQQP